jgi:uncharacterized membrane protein (DUF373 family)
MINGQSHVNLRKYLNLIQDAIVVCLCLLLFAGMGIKLLHLWQAMMRGVDFSLFVGDVLFILVLLEVFRLLLIYLEEHRVWVATMVEVGIVSTLREVILISPTHISWVNLLVICAFLTTLGLLLRYAGIRPASFGRARIGSGPEADMRKAYRSAVPATQIRPNLRES